MVVNNWKNSENELEKDNKKKPADIIDFKKDFISESLVSKNNPDRNKFIQDIMNDSSLAWTDVEKDLKKFYAKNQEKYPWIDLDKINIEDFRRLVVSDFLKIKNSRESLKEKVLLDYDITSGDYDKKFQTWIEKLSKQQIDNLIRSDLNLSKFIEKDIKIKLEKREKFKFFKQLTESETKKRLSMLSHDWEKEVETILWRYEYSSRLSDSDIRILFSYNFFKKEEKAEFVHTFIPFVTLDKAVEIWLLTDKDAREKKKEINENILQKEGLSQESIDEMLDYLNLSDIKIATKDINDEKILDEISDKVWFSNFEADLKEWIDTNTEEIIKNWPKSLFELSEALKTKNKWGNFNNLEKFIEWNFIEFTTTITKDGESKKEKNYIKIVWNNEQEKKFSYVLVGWNASRINIKWVWNSIDRFYTDFLNWFEDWKTSLDFFTKKEMEWKVESWELIGTDLDLINVWDLQNNDEKRKQVQEKYKNKLDDEIKFIEEKLESWEDNLNKEKLEIELNQKRDELLELEGWNVSIERLSNFENFNKLLEKLDLDDPDWKNIISDDWRKGLFKGMFLQTEKWWYFEISGIDIEAWTITVINNWEEIEPPLSFYSFYEAFKHHNTKRLDPINDFEDLISKWVTNNNLWWWDFKDKWSDHKFEDWKLIAENVEDWDETWDREVEYLVSDTSNEIIKICSTSGGMVEIQKWTRTDLKSLSKKEWQKHKPALDSFDKPLWEILNIVWAEKVNISITELEKLIKKEGLYPNRQTWKAIKEKTPEWAQNKFKWSIWSKIFSNFSVAEVIKSWKLFVESFQETLKKWNEIHAAKAALRMWKFLPGDLKRDLQIKVENAEKTEMDKEIEDLWKVDSPIAIGRILKWLLNKDIVEHKKEAAMLFMLDRYWHLSAKSKDLYKFRWKWLWYEAFGWRKNDSFFLEIKKRCDDTWVSFSEEFLMLHLLKKQCKQGWFNWINRRTRLHKEFEGKWSSWVDSEFDKWYGDADRKRTAKEMVSEWMFEAINWTTSNAVWWFKKSIERGWSLEDMSEWFFCLLYAGVFKNIDQKTFVKIKRLWDWDWLWIIMSRFASSTWEMNIFNDTVLHLSKRIATLYPGKYSKIADEAQDIANDVEAWKNESDILEKTQRFWQKYNTVLVGALNMINTWDNTHSKTNKIIFLEKDWDWPQAESFNKYYNKVKWYTTEEDALNSKIMNDALKEKWITWLDVYQMARRFLNLWTQGSFRDDVAWNNVWDEIYSDISSINNKRLVDDNKSNEENIAARKKYLLDVMKDLVSGLISTSAEIRLLAYNSNWSNIWKFFNTIWLHIKNDLADNYSKDEIRNDKANYVLMKAVDKIIGWALDWSNTNFVDPLARITEPTKKDTQNIVNQMDEEINY